MTNSGRATGLNERMANAHATWPRNANTTDTTVNMPNRGSVMPDTAVYKYWGAVSNKAGTKKATHRTLSTTMELMATSEAKATSALNTATNG